jgi:peptidoglycan/LPS O-acetylase OafA/YrhL
VLFSHSLAVTGIGSEMARGLIEARFGRFGVLLFFVHTSLVLMLSMRRSAGDHGWPMRFYIQRIFRIYPLSTLCVLTVLFFRIPPVLHSVFVPPSHWNLIANVALFQNLPNFTSLSGPLWSLPFEMQMYICLPVAFWSVRRYGRPGAYSLIALSLLIAIAEKALFPDGPWLSQFFPCFMGGVLAYAMLEKKPSLPAFAWPAFILTLAAGTSALDISPWLQWGACLFLGAVIPFFRDARPGPFSAIAHTIARFSYGIYLTHMPLRWLCFQHLRISTFARWPLYFSLVAILSISLYYLVEQPMTRLGKRLATAYLSDKHETPATA